MINQKAQNSKKHFVDNNGPHTHEIGGGEKKLEIMPPRFRWIIPSDGSAYFRQYLVSYNDFFLFTPDTVLL